MKKTLVAYFSASGVTARAAKTVAEVTGGYLFEIKPAIPYTKEDLNWMNKNSRSSVEMRDKASRPEIAEVCENMSDYKTIFLGFPIWWYVAPTIINTFLESYDFSGKTIILFATSGGSGFGRTTDNLKISVSRDTVIKEGGLLNGHIDKVKVSAWINGLQIQKTDLGG